MALSDAAPYAVAHYALDEASGNAIDSVNGYDATETSGTIGTAAGKFGNARDFEQADTEYFERADNADLSTGDNLYMVRVWVYAETLAAFPVIASKGWAGSQDANSEWALYYDVNVNRFAFSVRGGTTTTDVTANNFGAASTGTWYLIHAWHDPTANQIGISVNAGTADTASHTAGVNDGADPLQIGASVDQGIYWDGLIDDFVILKGYILDATERSEDYNSGTGVAFEDWAAAGTVATPDPVSATWSTVAPGKSLVVTPDATDATWSAVAPAKSLAVTPDAAAATWSTISPAKSLAVTPAATAATWSAVAPTKSLALAQSPAAATWTAVQPSVSVTITASPASAAWSAVEPSTGSGQFAAPDPVVSTWSVVAPSLSLSRSVQPASVTWQARAVGSKQLTLAPSPVSVQWAPAAPAVVLRQTPSPAGVVWSTPAPSRALVRSVSAVSAAWAVPAVTVGEAVETKQFCVKAKQIYTPGVVQGEVFTPGVVQGQAGCC